MRQNITSLAEVSSARQLAEYEDIRRAQENDIRAANERNRKVGDATIELNEQTKRQNEILKAQLAEAQKANELLVKQAADSARFARVSLIVAVISVLATILSLVLR